MFIRVHHVQITVEPDQLDEARSFYVDTLGLNEIEKPRKQLANPGFWLQLGDTQVHVGCEEITVAQKLQTKVHVAYEISDVSELSAKLAPWGIQLQDDPPVNGYIRFQFRDPFGNKIEILSKSDQPS